ncbi:efflux RND transporter periplasmic adaptor subunit [Hyalangium minutum]|uniref:Macrolide-specific efflux protein MacA n=1 Tax=Hyalangium minutum TaxID=394096 RepID=A0A085WW53_9BACT|nr:efflux RND transporter periplasmic adaptor subunit [Hyalangium minutum]KFE71916.1 Macrolide-specific efflux protein MacA [Hyalangium minutum]
MNWKKVVLILGVLALVGAGVYFVRGQAAAKTPQRELPTAEAKRMDMEIVAEASGLLEPIRVVEVKSKASGEVLRVLVETGNAVKQGDLLTEIDPRDVQNALIQAEADLESAQVRMKTVEAQRQRMEALRATGVVTQQELETAVDAAATARAAVVRADTNLQLARERRKDVTIRAPIDGTILERTIEPGQIIASATTNVSGGTTLFKMADMSEMQVRTKVDETDIGKIRPGLEARVSLEAYPSRTFTGEVVKIEPQAVVEQNVTLFPVLIRLKNPEGLLKPGMNAEVGVQIASRQDVVTVPNTAVVSPREAATAASALGLDEATVRATLRPSGAAPSTGPAPETPAAPSPECAELFERLKTDAGPPSLSDADREKLQACRPEGMAEGGGRGGRFRGGQGQQRGNNADRRPGVVFVQQQDGSPQPRRVMLGLSDWENTEVLNGLEAGEKVLLVAVAQLQQQQQQSMDRMRQRAGGVIPGAGGGARGGGGGGGGGGGTRR